MLYIIFGMLSLPISFGQLGLVLLLGVAGFPPLPDA